MSLVETSVENSKCKNCSRPIYKVRGRDWVHVLSGSKDIKECKTTKAKPQNNVSFFCPQGTLSKCINCNHAIVKAVTYFGKWYHPELDQDGIRSSWYCTTRLATPTR